MNMIAILLISAVIVSQCESARILVTVPLAAKSHHYVIQPLIRELISRGHDITHISAFPLGVKAPNLKEIIVKSTILDKMKDQITFDFIQKMGKMSTLKFFGPISFWFIGMLSLQECLPDPEVQKLIHSDTEKFDLIILETHFAQEALLGFGHKFNAPVVSLSTFGSFNFIDEFIGNPHATAYLTSFDLPYTNKLTYLQRLANTVRLASTLILGYCLYLPRQESMMRQYFNHTGSENMPTIIEMLQEVALVITNSQISVDYAKPLVPNIIPAGGMHISNTTKPLPQDLKMFLDESKNGVVYFSFGSVVPSEDMPVDMRDGFIKAFKKLKQNVLWKLPLDSVPGLPSNVRLAKWLPQQDVLAHPNVKAFITHGGLLSQQEAVYHAVPLIGVPFFGDQYMNIERAAVAGFALQLSQYNITEESVTWALNEVLYKPSYKENMKKHSIIFRDNPETPLEKAAYWVEYVIRHKGAPHLRAEGRHLSYVKYLLLDVITLITGVLIVLLAIVYCILKSIYSCICGGQKKQQFKEKQHEKKTQ